MALLAALGLFVVTSSSSEIPPVVVEETSVPAVALPDGETFAHINEVGTASVTVDPALLLSGQEARAAAESDGMIAPGEDLPNDFYIQNTEPAPVVVGVEPDADVTVLTFDSAGGITEADIALSDLATAFTAEYSGVAIYGLVAGEFPVHLTIEEGAVVEIHQVSLP